MILSSIGAEVESSRVEQLVVDGIATTFSETTHFDVDCSERNQLGSTGRDCVDGNVQAFDTETGGVEPHEVAHVVFDKRIQKR